MTKTLPGIRRLSFVLVAAMATSAYAQQSPGHAVNLKDGYNLVWADEFNEDGPPDPGNWKHEKGFVRNEELQWYQSDNALCKKGLLIIEARAARKPNPGYKKGSRNWRSSREYVEYTSSSITTAGLHSWKYGRFVMRGKIDISEGLWPAWWTLGVSGEWPANGEIDMMEYYKGTLLANIAVATTTRYSPEWHSSKTSVLDLGGKAWASRFHVWRMDWTTESISLFVDDRLLIKVDMDKLYNKDGSGNHPFKEPHYMLLNLALGGTNGGPVQNTRFPKRFEIDYVRVYKKQL